MSQDYNLSCYSASWIFLCRSLINALNPPRLPPTSSGNQTQSAVRIEAAHVVASLAYGRFERISLRPRQLNSFLKVLRKLWVFYSARIRSTLCCTPSHTSAPTHVIHYLRPLPTNQLSHVLPTRPHYVLRFLEPSVRSLRRWPMS